MNNVKFIVGTYFVAVIPQNVITIIKLKRMAWAGREEEIIQGFSRKTERKRSLGRPSRRSEENIKRDVKEIGWDSSGSG
jgi:hypothetical protein